jgi:pimeloyl-ACP methyl ester carboxylesterase
MATYVLVHGGWDGGWAWTPVAKELRAAGHEAFTPTLTGSGERVHLASPDVDLDTHILDIANVLRYEDLHDVTLVGSSGGGMVITGVVERVPERIGHLIYLDAFVPEDGQSAADMMGPEVMASWEEVAQAQGDGWRFPGGTHTDRKTDVMLKMAKQPLAVSNPAAARLKRTYVLFTNKPADSWLAVVFGKIAARIRNEEGWSYYERPFVHYPCLDQEDGVQAVAELLLELG